MNESSNRKIGSFLSMLNMGIGVLVGLVYVPFAIEYLGKSEYGIFTLAMGLIAYLSIFDMGFGNALVRYTARFKQLNKEVESLYGFFLMLFTGIAFIVGLIGLGVYLNIESFFTTKFNNNEVILLKNVYIILLINIVLSFPASVFSAIIRAHEKFIFANSVVLLRSIFLHGGYIILLIIGFHSVALSFFCLFVTIFFLIINVWYCFRAFKLRFIFDKIDSDLMKEIFRYSFFVFLNLVICQLYDNTDYVILGKFSGSVAISVYSVGVLFMSSFQQLSTCLSSVYLPYMSKLSVSTYGLQEMSRVFIIIGRLQFILLMFVLIGFVVFGKTFISLWVGVDFFDAYYIALIVLIPSLIPLSQNIGISILQAINKHSVRSNVFLVIAILNILISIPLAIKYSAIGASIGTCIGIILGQILFMNWYYSNRIGLNICAYWKIVLRITIQQVPLLLLMQIINFLIVLDGWSGLGLKVLTSLILSLPYLYKVVLNEEEKLMIKSFLQK